MDRKMKSSRRKVVTAVILLSAIFLTALQIAPYRGKSAGPEKTRRSGRPAAISDPAVELAEVRNAAAENPASFVETVHATAGRSPSTLIRCAEIGVNAGLRDEPRELLAEVLDSADGFNEYFHVMRLAFKCGDRGLAEKSMKLAQARGLTDFQRRKLEHFHEVYEKRHY